MSDHRVFASTEFLRSRGFLVPCTVVFLLAFGCDTDESVRRTVPTDGDQEIAPQSDIVIQFSASFDEEEDGDSVQDGITVEGDMTGVYQGTVQITTYNEARDQLLRDLGGAGGDGGESEAEEEIDPNQLINDILSNPDQPPRGLAEGDGSDGDGSGGDGSGGDGSGGDGSGGDGSGGDGEPEEEPSEKTDTILWKPEGGVTFKPGETITVAVSHDITVGGTHVESYTFRFRITTDPTALGGQSALVVTSTQPPPSAVAFGRNPRVAATFSRGVDAATLDGNLSVHGDQSGEHIDLQVAAAEQTTSGVVEVTSRLGGGDQFIPGEWVTVTLSEGIQAAEPSEGSEGSEGSTDSLRPYSYRFQVAPGRVSGGWLPEVQLPTESGASRVAVGEWLADFDGREIVVLGAERLALHYQTAAGMWAAITSENFGAEYHPVDLAVADLVGGDRGDEPFEGDAAPDAVVLFRGSEGIHVRSYGVDVFQRLVENWRLTLPVDLPDDGLVGFSIVDIDQSGDLDLLVYHAQGTHTPAPTADVAEPVSVPTGRLTVISKNAATAEAAATFQGRVPFTFVNLVATPRRLETADLDNDGRVDLVVESEAGLELYRNEGAPTDRYRFEFKKRLSDSGGTLFRPGSWGLEDLDADGDVDVVAWPETGVRGFTLRNTVFVPGEDEAGEPIVRRLPHPSGVLFAALTLAPNATLDLEAPALGAAPPRLADFDGDRVIDVLATDGNGGIYLFAGVEGEPLSFTLEPNVTTGVPGTTFDAATGLREVAFADIDGDTGPDVVALSTNPAASTGSGSVLRAFRSTGVEASGPARSFAISLCDDDGESQFGPDCTEQDARLFDGRTVQIPLVGSIDQGFAGYDVALKYNEELFRFTRFELPPTFSDSNLATFTVCGGAGDSDCDGFVHVSVVFAMDGNEQITREPGEEIFLGTLTFRALAVEEVTDSEFTLVSSVDDASGTVRDNAIVIVDGSARPKLSAAPLGNPLHATVFPPLLRIEACEVTDVRQGDFTVQVPYETLAEEFGATQTNLRVTVNGATVQHEPCADRSDCVEVLAGSSPADVAVTASFDLDPSATVERVDVNDSCTAEIPGNILQPLVTCETILGENLITWQLETPVAEFRIYRNGELFDIVSGLDGAYLDSDPPAQGRVNYGVEGWISNVHGPRGHCKDGPLGEPVPSGPLAPSRLELTLAERPSADSPLELELAWTNGEAYDRIDLEIFRESALGLDAVLTESLVGTPTAFRFAGTEPHGVEPGIYGYKLTAFSDSRSVEVVSPNRTVEVPGFPAGFLTCDAVGADVLLHWGAVWGGYSALEVRAVDRSNPDGSISEFIGPDSRLHVFADLPFSEYEFSVRGLYKEGFLPSSIASQGTAATCSASLRPKLTLATVETGIGLDHRFFMPIRADLPARATGFTCAVELPAFVDLALASAPPQSASEAQETLLLNDDPAADDSSLQIGLALADGAGPNRTRLEIDVSGASFSPGEDVVLAWIVGTIDWNAHGFELWGEYGLRFRDFDETSRASLTFAAEDGGEPVRTGDVTLSDARADLIVYKRHLSISVERPTDLSEPVPVEVNLTFDSRQVAGFTLRVVWDASVLELEPFDSADLEQTVVENYGFPGFPTDEVFDDARTTGDLTLPWIGLFNSSSIDEAFLEPGVDQTLAILRFRIKGGVNAPATVLPISFVVDSSQVTSGQISDVFFDPRVASDNWPNVAFFDGGIEVEPRPGVPALVAIDPDHGSMAGGAIATLHGLDLLVAPEERDDIRLKLTTFLDASDPLFETDPTLRNPLVVEVPAGDVLWDESTDRALRFRVPPAPAELYDPERASVEFDVRIESAGGLSMLEGAYRYENLTVVSTNRTAGIAEGGEEMVIRGTGFAETAEVIFEVPRDGGKDSFDVVDYLERDPSGRELRFLTPAMEVSDDSIATVQVTVPGLGLRELPVKFLIERSAVIRGVTPDSGSILGGDRVEIEVAGFDSLVAPAVTFGDAGAEVVEVRDDRFIVVNTPAGSEVGPVGVRVVSGGVEAFAADTFTYLPSDPPRIVSIEPAEGRMEGGNTVRVGIENFQGIVGEFVVLFGSERAEPLTEVAPGLLEVIAPPADERGEVDVTVHRGTTLSATLQSGYRYLDPEITRVEPPSGPTTGGTLVTVEVIDFGTVTESAVVRFGLKPAEIVAVENEGEFSSLTVVAPSDCSTGAVDVSVENADSSSSAVAPGAYRYLRLESLRITDASPTHVAGCGGEIVTLTGQGFCADVALRYHDILVETFDVVDGNTIRFTAPETPEGLSELEVAVSLDGELFEVWSGRISVGARFTRGDVDQSGAVDTTDVVVLGRFLSGSSQDIVNFDALDVNDDGDLNTGDLMVLTNFAFGGGVAPPPPFPEPGVDPTADDLPRCVGN